MRTMHQYLGVLRERPGSASAAVDLHRALTRLGYATGPDGTIPTMAAHLLARQQLTVPDGRRLANMYAGFKDHVAAVERHAEHVEALIPYLSERGIEAFTDEAFAEYLSSGPLRDGTL